MTSCPICPVCCEKTRFNVCCEKCKYNSCRVCVRTYLCGQLTEPHCMNCKTKWNLDFVEDAVGSTFYKNEFKKAQSNTYYEFEKTQLPLVQDEIKEFLFNEKKQSTIERINKENKMKVTGRYGCIRCVGVDFLNDDCNKCIKILDNEKKMDHRNNVCYYLYYKRRPSYFKQLAKEFKLKTFWRYRPTQIYCDCNSKLDMNSIIPGNTFYKCTGAKCAKKYCKECLYELNPDNTHINGSCIKLDEQSCPCCEYTCDKCIVEINKDICALIRVATLNGDGVPAAAETERRKFIMKCQVPDCAGFLSTQYKCGVCDKLTCPECLDIKENDDHVCKQENVESAKLIKKETKPCPTCATRISKIDGCDQMWCVDCKTAFSWNTGQISNTKIHNPHYYEYLRQTQGSVPRDPADIPGGAAACARFPTSTDVHLCLQKLGVPSNLKNMPKNPAEITEDLLRISHKAHNLYQIIENNVNQIHRFIVELDTLVRDNNFDIYDRELTKCRVLYSLKRMDIDTFKRNTYMYHQKAQHHNNFIQVMTMFKQVCKDLFGFVYDIIKNFRNLNKLDVHSNLVAYRFIQYEYLYENNKKINDLIKQLKSSIVYIQSNLPKNKYYTNDCDKARIIFQIRKFNEEDLSYEIQHNDTYDKKSFKDLFTYYTSANISNSNDSYSIKLRYTER